MRAIILVIAASAFAAPAFAESLDAGIYKCRTPGGTETGSSFAVDAAGRYGDTPDAFTGRLDFDMGEVRFDGAGNDGKIARVISDRRVKIGKRIFCNWEKPLPKPAAASAAEAVEEPQAGDAPRAKLIIVQPELRR
ncbi:MAG: hypothetical protein QM698_14660 [Micropepsaceae bacterium]